MRPLQSNRLEKFLLNEEGEESLQELLPVVRRHAPLLGNLPHRRVAAIA